MKAQFLVIVSACLVLAAGCSKEDPTKRDWEKLQGVWTLVAAEIDGGKSEVGAKFSMRVEIKGDKYELTHVEEGKKEKTRGAIKVDPSQKPKAVDFRYKQLGLKGIYELDGDSLKVCFHLVEGEPRPKEFSAKKGSRQALMVWKREKH